MDKQSPCAQRDELASEYTRCSIDLIRTTLLLAREGTKLAREQLENTVNFRNTARLKSDQAYEALERHIQEHGC